MYNYFTVRSCSESPRRLRSFHVTIIYIEDCQFVVAIPTIFTSLSVSFSHLSDIVGSIRYTHSISGLYGLLHDKCLLLLLHRQIGQLFPQRFRHRSIPQIQNTLFIVANDLGHGTAWGRRRPTAIAAAMENIEAQKGCKLVVILFIFSGTLDIHVVVVVVLRSAPETICVVVA